MNQLLVKESVTGTDVLNSSIWIKPSVMNLPTNVSEGFTYVLRVHADVRELPTLPL